MLDQFSLPGIQYDVSAAVEQIGFLLDDIGFIAPLEDMSDTIVSPVKELPVDLVQVLHPFGQVCVRGFNHQMVMLPIRQ